MEGREVDRGTVADMEKYAEGGQARMNCCNDATYMFRQKAQRRG